MYTRLTLTRPLEKPGDAFLIVEGTMDEPEMLAFAGGTVAALSKISPSKDKGGSSGDGFPREGTNEDALAVLPFDASHAILAVADGAGGMPGADRASRLALLSLQRSLAQARDIGTPLREAVLLGIEDANRAVAGLDIGAASTLAIAELSPGYVRTYHVGDSPVLVVGRDGQVKLLTMSHSPVGYALESGMLDEREAMQHEDRHLLSNCVGVPQMWIEMSSPVPFEKGDTLLIASDGLYDNMHTDEIVEVLCDADPARAVAQLAAESWRRMREPRQGQPSKPDDLTLLAFRA